MNPMDSTLSERTLGLLTTCARPLSAREMAKLLSPSLKKDINRVLYRFPHLFKMLPGTPPRWTLAQPSQEAQHKEPFKQTSEGQRGEFAKKSNPSGLRVFYKTITYLSDDAMLFHQRLIGASGPEGGSMEAVMSTAETTEVSAADTSS